MDLAKDSLRKLDSDLGGHLAGETADSLLRTFEIRFAASLPPGHAWPERVAAVAAAGVNEVILPVSLARDASARTIELEAIEPVRAALSGEGVSLAAIDLDFASFDRFRRGALTHSDSAVRRAALALALETVSLAKAAGADSVRVRPDTDGWDAAFQVNHGASLQHFLDAIDEINAKARAEGVTLSLAPAAPGVRAGGAVIGDVHAAAFAAERLNRDGGGKNVGVSVDCAEALGGGAEAIHFARVAGVPVREVSLGAPPSTVRLDHFAFCDALYAAVDTGFEGVFVADADAGEEATARSLTVARELFANALRRALLVYRDKDVLLRAQAQGDAGSVVAAVARAAVGGLPIRVAAAIKAPAKKRPARAGR